jgi:DNA-binding response OmpR family regulator
MHITPSLHSTSDQSLNPSEPERDKPSAAPIEKFKTAAGGRILVVDDDEIIARFLKSGLEFASFSVDMVHDGETALAMLQETRRYDLVILDLNLPKLDGFSLLQRIRPAQPRLPVLVLTARNQLADKVKAFNCGADDCLTKPFSLLELQARVVALMRRNSGLIANISTSADLTLNREEHRVERNGRQIELTPREFAILEYLMRHAGQPVSRATFLEEVWNLSRDTATNIVDVYMKYVRDKVDCLGEQKLIHTIRGVGYVLRVE